MKKILLITLLLSQANFAQSIFPIDGGNVGIGILNPTSNLEIRETINTSVPAGQTAPTKSILKFSRNGTIGYSYNENAEFRLGHGGNSVYGSKLDLYINGNSNTNSIPDQHVMTWNYNGNVGIGTDAPNGLLDVRKTTLNAGGKSIVNIIGSTWAGDGASLVLNQLWNDLSYKTIIDNFGSNNAQTGSGFRVQTSYWGGSKVETITSLTLTPGGDLGIGIINPTNKLDVNGTIHSKEVKVDLIGWPDFVFKKEYNLPTLAEVEKYIIEKEHLENIPSEEEVLKNGINLGEMNAKLLQKIEELTLYMINQNKSIENLVEENKKQNVEIANLKKTLSSK